MKHKSIKLLLWAIFVMLFSICLRVLFIGYETPNLVIWLSFALPVVSIVLAIGSWITEHISKDNEK